MKIAKVAALIIVLITSASVWAHSGGTDSNGCHHDRKRGGYHCH
ncbi:YHYH domain-containing protein [Polaromonas sp.]